MQEFYFDALVITENDNGDIGILLSPKRLFQLVAWHLDSTK